MCLHDSIIWALAPEGVSGIKIFCDSSISEEIDTFFKETFNQEWSNALEQVAELFDVGDMETPAFTSIKDYGILVTLDALAIYDDYENECNCEFSHEALENTLETLVKRYPNVKYEGYVGYYWSASRGGEVEQYELSSSKEGYEETDKVYDFVGNAIAFRLQYDADEFWEELSDQLSLDDLEEFKKVLNSFHAYRDWIRDDTYEKLLDIADETNDEFREKLEEIIKSWETD